MFKTSMADKLTVGDCEQFVWIVFCVLLGSKCLQVGVNGPTVSTLSTQRAINRNLVLLHYVTQKI